MEKNKRYMVGDIVKCDRGIGKVVANSRDTMVLVELLENKRGHDACTSINSYQNDEYWWTNPIAKLDSEEIQIVKADGKIMLSIYDDGNLSEKKVFDDASKFSEWAEENLVHKRNFPEYVEIISNNCYPWHDFEIGAVVFVVNVKECFGDVVYECYDGSKTSFVSKNDVKPVKLLDRLAKKGEYVFVTDPLYTFPKKYDVAKITMSGEKPCVKGRDYPRYTGDNSFFWSFTTSCCKVIDGYVPIKDFCPHLVDTRLNDRPIGNIGDPTDMKDARGNELFIGDIVTVLAKSLSGKLDNYGMEYVCMDEEKAFVMGVKSCSFEGGDYKDFIIIKEKSYEDLDDGEIHDGVKAVLKND